MRLCRIVSGKIRYVKKCFKNSTKLDGNKKGFIRLHGYDLILPNKIQTKIAMSIYNTKKIQNTQKIENGFCIFKV